MDHATGPLEIPLSSKAPDLFFVRFISYPLTRKSLINKSNALATSCSLDPIGIMPTKDNHDPCEPNYDMRLKRLDIPLR